MTTFHAGLDFCSIKRTGSPITRYTKILKQLNNTHDEKKPFLIKGIFGWKF